MEVIAVAAVWGCGGARSRPNIVLVTVDTLRADHLSVYGYPRDTSPELASLANGAAVFKACYTQSTTTGASHASLFTSRHPRSSGVTSNGEGFPPIPSLMDLLGSAGYARGGFVSSIIVGRRFRIDGEFDHFDDHFTAHEANRPDNLERPAALTVRAALDWLQRRPEGQPFFVWIHLIDPHGPYQPPEDAERYVGDAFYNRDRRQLALSDDNMAEGAIPAYQRLGGEHDAAFYIARYDAEIHYADASLGVLFREMGRSLLENTVVVVTSDHGETLSEPGHRRLFSHGSTAYEEVSRVPLIIRGARGRLDPRQLNAEAQVRLIDIAPTLLRMVGAPALAGAEGRDLFSTDLDDSAETLTFSAYGANHPEARFGTQFSVLSDGFRYIVNAPVESEELYDHGSDPGEIRNLAPTDSDRRELMRGRLRHFFATTPEASPEAIPNSPEWAEQLRSLGYLN